MHDSLKDETVDSKLNSSMAPQKVSPFRQTDGHSRAPKDQRMPFLVGKLSPGDTVHEHNISTLHGSAQLTMRSAHDRRKFGETRG